jgi:hypothetical protein
MLNFVENLLENERDPRSRPMNDQDHSLSLSDPDRSLVLSHFLTNFLQNLASCHTAFIHLSESSKYVPIISIKPQACPQQSKQMYRSIMAVKVSRVLSGTSTKKQLPDSHSIPPKTQCPSRH